MTFDFSALLVALTFGSGLIWAIDAWLFAPRRRAAGSGEKADRAADDAREPVLVEYARSFFPVFLIVLLLRSFLVEPFRIPSASMMPTLLIGDFILVNKFDYGIRLPVLNTKIIDNGRPERGDIVVFRYPEDPSIPYIKRVVGIPGDTVTYRNRALYINGQEVPRETLGTYDGRGAGNVMDGASLQIEHLGDTTHSILLDRFRPSYDFQVTVPEKRYFVLGDNRDNSRDSRFWGFVPDHNLVGRAFLIWMNWDTKSGGIQWNRIGTIIE